MRTARQVATAIERNIITVHRALLANEMPGAFRLDTGQWVIPNGVADEWVKEYKARVEQMKTPGRKPRCDANARRGTGYGRCDSILDSRGQCPYASDHVET